MYTDFDLNRGKSARKFEISQFDVSSKTMLKHLTRTKQKMTNFVKNENDIEKLDINLKNGHIEDFIDS